MKKYLLGIVVLMAAVFTTAASAGKFTAPLLKYYNKYTGSTSSPTVTTIQIDHTQVGNQGCPATSNTYPCLVELDGSGNEMFPAIRTRP